jgi:hypothetical protein
MMGAWFLAVPISNIAKLPANKFHGTQENLLREDLAVDFLLHLVHHIGLQY